MTMDELVQQLAVVQAEIAATTEHMNRATAGADQRIEEAERALEVLKEHRIGVAAPFIIGIADGERLTDEIETQIINEWTGEKTTMVFDAGTLKFAQRGNLKIHDEVWLMNDILDRMSVEDIFKKKYLKGFNLTAIKRYMGVHDLPVDVAEIEYTATVKLEAEG